LAFTAAYLILAGCAPKQITQTIPNLNLKTQGQDCYADTDCQSGICNFIKENFGQCQPAQCATGDQTIGVSGQTTYYCDHNNQWQKIRQFGETCNNDYECVKITCKDNPGCHPGDFKYYCKDNKCAAEQQQNECVKQGLVRINEKEAFTRNDGSCVEVFIEQREEPTVCAPCGNGVCDTELENKCNCPADCPKNETNKILTDQELIDYFNSDFDKQKMMFKEIILGTYNNTPVKVSFPCSDVCPNYTIRIIRYDIELNKCDQANGVIKELNIPIGIAIQRQKFCLPKVIANLSNN